MAMVCFYWKPQKWLKRKTDMAKKNKKSGDIKARPVCVCMLVWLLVCMLVWLPRISVMRTQGFTVRKDMDQLSQLIHFVYTEHPHQSIQQFTPVPKTQECFSFVWNARQQKRSNLIPGLTVWQIRIHAVNMGRLNLGSSGTKAGSTMTQQLYKLFFFLYEILFRIYNTSSFPLALFLYLIKHTIQKVLFLLLDFGVRLV